MQRRGPGGLGPVAGALALVATVVGALSAHAGPSTAPAGPPLLAGVGRADITPPTGYYMQGWVRSDAVARGQHTRLYARAIVLARGDRKVALVAEDLNGIAGGVVKAAADSLHDRGFSEENVLDSASHTHAAPSGYFNFTTYNTVFMTAHTLTQQNVTGSRDPQLYAFEVRQLALAIRRADDNLGPAQVGWGSTTLLGITQNRSLEAHLANYGVMVPPGKGTVAMDPGGYPDTIDPDVEVLRVDKLINGSWAPVGMWSTFADHGTVNKYTFGYYNADHHGSATRVVEDALRTAGRVPAGQDVVNAYGNTDEGDQTAGIVHSGPAAADWVGRQEAAAMLRAWQQAEPAMTSTPVLDMRWTRVCFCGQNVTGGRADSRAVVGLPLFTGSEEGRGPLYDITHVSFEGMSSPVVDPLDPAQGHKAAVFVEGQSSVPRAVPVVAVRIAGGVIASIPGEMTVEMGRRVRGVALAAIAGTGVDRVVISGLANEYLSYFTTPQEFERQHYEGGSTLYGEFSSNLFEVTVEELVMRLAHNSPPPPAYAYDPRNGVVASAAPFPTGATSAQPARQPETAPRLARASFAWAGGVRGFDRPLDTPFVSVRHQGPGGWVTVADDLGLQILWKVDDKGGYQALWQVPLDAPAGRYQVLITANHYTLASNPFDVVPSRSVTIAGSRDGSGALVVTLGYPAPVVNVDLTDRPSGVDGGTVRAQVNGQQVVAQRTSGDAFVIPGSRGARVTVNAGDACDTFGNCTGATASFDPAGGSAAAAPASNGAGTRLVPASTTAVGLPMTGGASSTRPAGTASVTALVSLGVAAAARRRARRVPQPDSGGHRRRRGDARRRRRGG